VPIHLFRKNQDQGASPTGRGAGGAAGRVEKQRPKREKPENCGFRGFELFHLTTI